MDNDKVRKIAFVGDHLPAIAVLLHSRPTCLPRLPQRIP
jgi:hypothetical protein